ncbi:MAG: Cytidylyltransferase family protein [Candidatus Methanofastidiosum methylothiophilum]|uniref:Cytidylyltransferase family protein n=1 Tax=Candidatus Methanofastidiosum methylothiophilum TaxID=1705564 RepID=A0A150IN18_9EURY|nr:MAG: Cytidylyltransferase family protein [Candidatus Methanofastidiosum methylthiophilus]KYC47153.1 MAG: Cytidylyltransferase family protein [Candidatus Methanofastidiosum methylthiophilus]KYC49569.1 MAG: Cytidylyltransferase family protein [Candidatus Methanofastidiosum methylthiophilus]
MLSGDILGLMIVYTYVAVLLFISEKILSKYKVLSRKFLHIMVGNVMFVLPIFETRFAMTFLAAAPFIPLTFLMSPHSPLKIKDKISSSGHGLGLVYYAISWTVLAFLFFDKPWIIAVGIAAMSYGDGMASLIGTRFGKRKYHFFGETKSIEGSMTMYFTLVIVLWIVLNYYNYLFSNIALVPINYIILIFVPLVATLFEGVTPRGLDNLIACFSATILYYLLTLVL